MEMTLTQISQPYFIGRTRIPTPVYSFEYAGRTIHVHKPLRPSGVFYGPGWQCSHEGVPICVFMNVDFIEATETFVRLSNMLGDDYEPKLVATLERNAKKVKR